MATLVQLKVQNGLAPAHLSVIRLVTSMAQFFVFSCIHDFRHAILTNTHQKVECIYIILILNLVM